MARRRIPTRVFFWNGNDWRRAWKTASVHISRAPVAVRGHAAFHQAIHMLDGAFVRGDALQFQIGILLLDCFDDEAIDRGDCSPSQGLDL